MLTECVAQTQLLDEALDFLDIPLNPCRLGAPYYADMMVYSEELVDLGNYSTSVVGAGVCLKILKGAENGSVLKDGVSACSFGLGWRWVQIDEVGAHLLGDVYVIVAVNIGRGDRYSIEGDRIPWLRGLKYCMLRWYD